MKRFTSWHQKVRRSLKGKMQIINRLSINLLFWVKIKRKYSLDLKSINMHAEKFKEEIDSFENLDSEIEKKRILYDEASNALIEKGLALSELRKEIMLDLKNKVTDELADLGFKSISFLPEHNFIKGDNVSDDGIEIKGEKIRFTRNGIDDIEFLISLNKGETERPLRKIASGGEISRIMLALKSVIGSVDNITTMIFDEIDAGIGGAVSLIVGDKQ